MRHTKVSSAWRPVGARHGKSAPQGIVGALVFNLCMLTLAVASAFAVLIIGRDHLYAYEYSEAGARVISTRVEQLNAELIQLDFDRYRQWDDLIALELMSGDIAAARGFMLSGREMLPPRYANVLQRANGDAEMELAGLDLLTPGTRARYEERVPLLSRRAESVASVTARVTPNFVGDADDFELMARALIAEPSTNTLQFILTGFSLGLAGDFGPEATAGAVALLVASRRTDYPASFGVEMETLLNEALPVEAFRTAAMASANGGEPGAFANAATAFRSAANATRAAQVREALSAIGAASDATSPSAAVDFITHATALRDLPRLRLLAQAAGERAAAAAKRLPRDGRLLEAARGDLRINRELAIALAIAGAALAGLLLILGIKAFQAGRRIWMRMQDDDYGSELVDIGANNWRPL